MGKNRFTVEKAGLDHSSQENNGPLVFHCTPRLPCQRELAPKATEGFHRRYFP